MWVCVAHLFISVLYFLFYFFLSLLFLGPNVVCVSAMSGFQLEDSKAVIRGFKSHDRQYNDQIYWYEIDLTVSVVAFISSSMG